LKEVRLYDGFGLVTRCTGMAFMPQPLLQRKVRAFLKRDVRDPVERAAYQHSVTAALWAAMKKRYGPNVCIKRCKDSRTSEQQRQEQQQQQQQVVGLAQQLQQPVILGLQTPELLRTGPMAAAAAAAATGEHAHHMNPRALFGGAQAADSTAVAGEQGYEPQSFCRRG
jgi:hypothetical protein